MQTQQPPPAKRNAKDKKRILELEREIRRRDRALAEALVVLSKALQTYFGANEVADTDEDNKPPAGLCAEPSGSRAVGCPTR